MENISIYIHILRILNLAGMILIITLIACSYEIYVYLAKEIYKDVKGYVYGQKRYG